MRASRLGITLVRSRIAYPLCASNQRFVIVMKDVRHLLLVPLVFLLSACASPTVKIQRESTDWLSAQVGPALADAVGSSRAALVEQWGEAPSITLDTTSNRHVEGQIDTLSTFRYDGLEVVYYVVSGNARELLTHVQLTRAGLLTGLPFDVGFAVDDVLNTLGPPTSQTSTEIRYEDEYDVLVFEVTGARVSLIKYIPYVD